MPLTNSMPSRNELYKAVNDSIDDIEEFLTQHDPLEIIASVSKHIAIFSIQDHIESEDMLWQPLIEYLMSLALAKPKPENPKKLEEGVFDSLLENWIQLVKEFTAYSGSEYVAAGGGTAAEIRFKLILDYFGVRKKAYQIHVEKTFTELFRPHRSHIIDKLGFSPEDFSEFIRFAETEITVAIQNELDTLHSLSELHSRFSKWTRNQDVEGKSKESIMDRFLVQNPDLASKKERVDELSHVEIYDVFEIKAQNAPQEKILSAISCSFGENSKFLEPEEWRAWPTNDTILYESPIIQAGEKYYLLNYATLANNRIEIMESLLEKLSKDYYRTRYLPGRDHYVEHTAMNLIRELLPNSTIFSNLYYYVKEDEITKRVEQDGLVLYDDCLLLVEAKAGMLPIPARRGAMPGLKTKVKEILKKGHNQACRALDYIHSSATADFLDENDNLLVSVTGSRYIHEYLILVTLEPLFVLTSHLSSAEELRLLSGKEWPWAVYINDLRVLADIIDHPCLFLHYLNRRIKLNSKPAIETYDELDYLMTYLRTGLYFEEKDLQEADKIIIVPETSELDEYYSDLSKSGAARKKPSMGMNPIFETLIGRLETEAPDHFTSTCFHLLDCDDETRSEIAKQIENCEQRFKIDKGPTSVAFRIDSNGLLLACVNNIDDCDDLVNNWSNKWLKQMDVNHVTVFLWTPPIQEGSIRVFKFGGSSSSGD